MCWDISDDYVFLLVRSDQSERITRMAITRSFPCSGSVCCGKFVAQIETFASHIGDTTQGADICSSLFVTKTVTFVSHQNVCVTPCGVTTWHRSDYVGGPPALLLSTHAAAVRWLWEAEVCVRQGCRGWWGGRANLQKISLSSNLNLFPHTWSFVGMPWKGERRRGVARSTPSWEELGGKRLLFGQQRKFTCCWYFPQLSWNWLLIVMYLIVLADLHCFWEPYSYCIANKNFFNVCSRKEQHWLYQHNSILI